MLFRIALALGKSVGEVECFDYREVLEWAAYFKHFPAGPDVDDERWSTLHWMFYEANKGENGKPTRQDDWKLRPREKITPAQLREKMRAGMLLLGAKRADGKD